MTPRLESDTFLPIFYFEIDIAEGQLKSTYGISSFQKWGIVYFHDKFTYLAWNRTIIYLII